MTITELISKFDNMFPNEFTQSEKEDWVNHCNLLCYNEIIANYEDAPEYDGSLVVPSPYDNLYLSYMAWNMYLIREEMDRYNNSATKFTTEWETWANWYNRNHRVKQKAVKYF